MPWILEMVAFMVTLLPNTSRRRTSTEKRHSALANAARDGHPSHSLPPHLRCCAKRIVMVVRVLAAGGTERRTG